MMITRKIQGSIVLKGQLRRIGFDVSGEIKDAKSPITIFINQSDIDKGRPSSPMKCTAAQCLQRAIGSKKVAMFKTTAYVQMPGSSDTIRYVVNNSLRKNVVVPQDNDGQPVAGTYTLGSPRPSRRQGEAYKRKLRLRELREAGLAPPAVKGNQPKFRPIRTRWNETV